MSGINYRHDIMDKHGTLLEPHLSGQAGVWGGWHKITVNPGSTTYPSTTTPFGRRIFCNSNGGVGTSPALRKFVILCCPTNSLPSLWLMIS